MPRRRRHSAWLLDTTDDIEEALHGEDGASHPWSLPEGLDDMARQRRRRRVR